MPAQPPRRRKSAAERGAPTRSRRNRRSPEAMQGRILAAAMREFSEHGFSGGRVDRISRQAHTVDRMLYYYFGNKDRLFRTVLEQAYDRMIQAQQDFQVDAEDPVEGMRRLVAHSWHHYLEHPELVRLVMTENLHRGRHIRTSARIRRLSLPLIDKIAALLRAGQARGLFRRDVEPVEVLLTVMALGFFYMTNRYTLSAWLGVDLMEEPRPTRWLEHGTRVVLDYLGHPRAVRAGRGLAAAPA